MPQKAAAIASSPIEIRIFGKVWIGLDKKKKLR